MLNLLAVFKSGPLVTIVYIKKNVYIIKVPHDLIIAKLHAYGKDFESLRLVSYLSNRHQRTKLDSVFSSCLQTIIGTPQGCILRPLFFNIFLNDSLLTDLKTVVCHFAYDNTHYCCGKTIKDVTVNLQSNLKVVQQWFGNSQSKANPGKFQY